MGRGDVEHDGICHHEPGLARTEGRSPFAGEDGVATAEPSTPPREGRIAAMCSSHAARRKTSSESRVDDLPKLVPRFPVAAEMAVSDHLHSGRHERAWFPGGPAGSRASIDLASMPQAWAEANGHTWPGSRVSLPLRLFLGRTSNQIDATPSFGRWPRACSSLGPPLDGTGTTWRPSGSGVSARLNLMAARHGGRARLHP